MPKRIIVTKETISGKNMEFFDNYLKKSMTKSEFVKAIENNNNNYQEKYHIRKINNEKIPCSNPDNSTNNNLD